MEIELPPEIWYNIFLNLDLQKDRTNASLVCHNWYDYVASTTSKYLQTCRILPYFKITTVRFMIHETILESVLSKQIIAKIGRDTKSFECPIFMVQKNDPNCCEYVCFESHDMAPPIRFDSVEWKLIDENDTTQIIAKSDFPENTFFQIFCDENAFGTANPQDLVVSSIVDKSIFCCSTIFLLPNPDQAIV